MPTNFSEFPLITISMALLLLGALLLTFIRGDTQQAQRNAFMLAFMTSTVVLLLTVLMYLNFDTTLTGFQFVESYAWFQTFNALYTVGVDGMSLLFILLTALLTPLTILASFHMALKRVRDYMIAFLVLEAILIGVFAALDLVLFYIFFEATLIPMYIVIGIWGGENRIYAAFKFFLYTFVGSVLMLVALIYMYQQSGTTAYLEMLYHPFSQKEQLWLWGAFFVAFAIKVPMWPVHTWLPDAHVQAPTAGSVMLAGVLLKLGGYGFLRYLIPLFPDASVALKALVYGLSIVAVIYTSLIAFVQKDMKKLIAYSSIAHMGVVTFGALTAQVYGIEGAIVQMFSHGLISAGLFMCVGILYGQMGTREIAKFGGAAKKMPLFAVLTAALTFASIGLPGTVGFIGEILVLFAAFSENGWLALGLASAMVLGAGYMLSLYRCVFLGAPSGEVAKKARDLSLGQAVPLIVLTVLVLFFGIYPRPLFQLTSQALTNITITSHRRDLGHAHQSTQETSGAQQPSESSTVAKGRM